MKKVKGNLLFARSAASICHRRSRSLLYTLLWPAPRPPRPSRFLEDNKGGQRQNIQIPGAGRNPRGAKGTLKFYLTNNLCIGSTKGSVSNNKPVYSDQCRTGYKVKLV